MARKAALTSEQATLISAYREAFDNVAQTEQEVRKAWTVAYMRAHCVIESGVTVRAAGDAAGVSGPTILKHAGAWPLVEMSTDAYFKALAMVCEEELLAHVFIGRIVDAGVKWSEIRDITATIQDAETLVAALSALIAAAEAAEAAKAKAEADKRKAEAAQRKAEADAKRKAEEDEKGEGEEGEGEPVITVESQWFVVARDMAVLAAKVNKSGIPSDVEHEAVMNSIHAYLSAVKARKTAAA